MAAELGVLAWMAGVGGWIGFAGMIFCGLLGATVSAMDDIAALMEEIANRLGHAHRHRAHSKDGCRAARADPDDPAADVDQKPNMQTHAQ